MADMTVDARGLQCPMPVIKTAQAIGKIDAGQTLEIIASDKGALSDIPAWADDMGHKLTGQFEEEGAYHFILQKS